MPKTDRIDLMQEIIKIARLPECEGTTEGYFTREQLIELHLYLIKLHRIISNAKEIVKKLDKSYAYLLEG